MKASTRRKQECSRRIAACVPTCGLEGLRCIDFTRFAANRAGTKSLAGKVQLHCTVRNGSHCIANPLVHLWCTLDTQAGFEGAAAIWQAGGFEVTWPQHRVNLNAVTVLGYESQVSSAATRQVHCRPLTHRSLGARCFGARFGDGFLHISWQLATSTTLDASIGRHLWATLTCGASGPAQS
jgi:hypothetical protein